jgi:hypothetical protein
MGPITKNFVVMKQTILFFVSILLAIRRYDLAIRRYDLATHRYKAVLDSISYVLRAPKPLKIKYIIGFDMGKLAPIAYRSGKDSTYIDANAMTCKQLNK